MLSEVATKIVDPKIINIIQMNWKNFWSSTTERKCLFLLQRQNTVKTLAQIHAFILKNNLITNLNILTKLISALSLADSHNGTIYARKLFDKMPHRPHSFFCNTIIKSHLHSRHYTQAIVLYVRLRRDIAFLPDNSMFSCLAKCCGLSSCKWVGMGVHGTVLRSGFMSDLYVATSLVDMYGKLGVMCFAKRVFDEMSVRSSVTWTALVTGYLRDGNVGVAEDFFGMTPEGEKDVASFNALIDGYVKRGEMGKAKVLFVDMLEKNVVSWTSMIDGYCSIGDVTAARSLFDEMPERNLYSWNVMIGGYCQNKQPNEALNLFQELLVSKLFEPDDVTIVSVLPAIAELGALDMGNWVFEFVKRKKLDMSVNVSTALVDMYAKCGSIDTAMRVFDSVLGRGTCTWNALINGLALNGCAKEALQVFRVMLKNGLKPNDITMLGVLSACNHGGLVDEGKKWFDKMKEFTLTPAIEHYGCLIDLLGRAGSLEEAEKLINAMPFEANGIILSSFLFACSCAKDVERAERMVNRAIDVEPCNDGNYIMLRNLYAGERRWNDVERIKRLMLTKGAKKEVGCSAIEINSQILEFIAGDKVHPHMETTHFVLDQMLIHMKGMDRYFITDCEA